MIEKFKNKKSKNNAKICNYLYVKFKEKSSKTYLYLNNRNLEIKVGDKVLVEANGDIKEAIVVKIESYQEKEVPYPINKTKNIISKMANENEIEDEEELLDELETDYEDQTEILEELQKENKDSFWWLLGSLFK